MSTVTGISPLSISSTKIVLVKGQSRKLTVKGGAGIVSWGSSNTAVAGVSAGKVVAKGKGKATITVLSKVQGNGGLWVKDTYQYDGVSISKTDSVSGIGDPYHKDPISGKYVPTPPSWWGPPVKTKWDRYHKDPETGATWMLVPDETKDADTTSGEEKARRYRQDPETGYWWKRVD